MSDLLCLDSFDSAVSPFDQIRRIDQKTNTEYWRARDLMSICGYAKWGNFNAVISRAKIACANRKISITDHFIEIVGKFPNDDEVQIEKNLQDVDVEGFSCVSGKTSLGGRPSEDYKLSRIASYLVAMNGDPNKPEIAAAQHYFATKTREAEVGVKPDDSHPVIALTKDLISLGITPDVAIVQATKLLRQSTPTPKQEKPIAEPKPEKLKQKVDTTSSAKPRLSDLLKDKIRIFPLLSDQLVRQVIEALHKSPKRMSAEELGKVIKKWSEGHVRRATIHLYHYGVLDRLKGRWNTYFYGIAPDAVEKLAPLALDNGLIVPPVSMEAKESDKAKFLSDKLQEALLEKFSESPEREFRSRELSRMMTGWSNVSVNHGLLHLYYQGFLTRREDEESFYVYKLAAKAEEEPAIVFVEVVQ